MGQQGLLSARVGALDPAQLRVGIVPVYHVQEHQPRIARLPGHLGQQVEDLSGVQLAGHLSRPRIYLVEIFPPLDLLHELGIHAYGYIEVDQRPAVFLGPDELDDVRVGYVQDAHVGAPTGTALLHHVGGRVEGANEAHRAAGNSPGRADHIALRPQAAEGEPRAAAALVDQGRLLHLVEYAVQRVFHGQHEAG